MEFVTKWFFPAFFFVVVVVTLVVVIKIAIWMWPAAVVAGHGVSYAITHPAEIVVGLLITFVLLGAALK